MAAVKTLTRPVLVPSTPAWDSARRRVDTVRSVIGRAATAAGAAAALAVLIHPAPLFTAAVVAATAVMTAVGAGILRLSAPFAGHQKTTATVLYFFPGTALTLLEAGEYAVAGAPWGGTVPMEVLAVAVWTGGVWLLRPARVSRRMVTPRPPAASGASTEVQVRHSDPAARWWSDHVAAEKGVAPGTVLEDVRQTGPGSFTATIRATVPGKAVPRISICDLSALLDVPEDDIRITAVPGRGAGVRRLIVGKDGAAAATDPATVWREQIAPLAMPGAVLTGIRVGKPGMAADYVPATLPALDTPQDGPQDGYSTGPAAGEGGTDDDVFVPDLPDFDFDFDLDPSLNPAPSGDGDPAPPADPEG